MTVLYDPPGGWRHGFPKPYQPLPGETLSQTLVRDGYPQAAIDEFGPDFEDHCRFIGRSEEIRAARRRP